MLQVQDTESIKTLSQYKLVQASIADLKKGRATQAQKRELRALEQALTEFEQIINLDYTYFDFNQVQSMDDAIRILQYLTSIERDILKQHVFDTLCEQWDITPEEDDEAPLTRAEKFLIASDLLTFVQYMFKKQYKFSFEVAHFHRIICTTLQNIMMGTPGSNPRTIICMPPRYGKTQIGSIYFPAFSIGHYPDSKNMLLSYSASLATINSAQVRDLMQEDFYKDIFPATVDPMNSARHTFKTTQNGILDTASCGSSLTGKGAGLMRDDWGGAIIVDDALNSSDARSPIIVDKTNIWISDDLKSRRNNERRTGFIFINQRLGYNDPTAYLTEEDSKFGEEFELLNIPAILNKAQLDLHGFPADDPSRLEGDPEADEYPLWPFRHSLKELRAMRDSNPHWFAGQMMQDPSNAQASILHDEWYQEYENSELPNIKFKKKVLILDTASTIKTYSDYSVITTLGIADNGIYVLDMVRKKLELPDLVREVEKAFIKHQPRELYIEHASSGIGLIQILKRSKYRMIIKKIIRQGIAQNDKVNRAMDVAPYIETGYVYVPKRAPWLKELRRETSMFGQYPHDDMIDTIIDGVDIFIVPHRAQAPSSAGLSKVPMTKKHNFGQVLKNRRERESESESESKEPSKQKKFNWNKLLKH